ncbi:MAG: 2,3-bisphosphoglycerate-independent phosphoglycerate mutase [Candidatus Omnitrophota bacterium]|nr:MAG: 2,3-bisphosphoglycerate-independent phosphoglycerate mutase [Candidatus Omnitrophota bacterium]
MKKILYIVLDGLGDLPIPQIGNKTPLEAAHTHNMDALAKDAVMGCVYTVGKGIAPESDIAVISILGYDAHKYYTGRGPLESYAEGLRVDDGDLAFRVNFATMEDETSDMIKDRRAGRNLSTEEATALSYDINKNVKLKDPVTFVFKNTIGHRGVLVIYAGKDRILSGDITNTDPAYAKQGAFGIALPKFEKVLGKAKPVEGKENDPACVLSAELINEFTEKSRVVLNNSQVNKKRIDEGKLPANVILSRDAGSSLPKFPKIGVLYNLRFGCFVEMPVEKGIALLTGMEVVDIPGPSGDLEKDYILRAEKVKQAVKIYDGLYIHIKGPDEPAHDGNLEAKMASIEAIDKFFFGKLIPDINLEDVVIAVTADHSTPCMMKAHTDDPVPFMLIKNAQKSDGIGNFSESNSKKGSIGTINGTGIMPLLIKAAK